MRNTPLLTLTLCGALILAAPAVQAQSTNDAAHASGHIAGSSVETGAVLLSSGLTVTAASVVAIAGTGAAIITADPALAEATLNLAGDIVASPFAGQAPLKIDDDIIIPDAAPVVPHGGRQP